MGSSTVKLTGVDLMLRLLTRFQTNNNNVKTPCYFCSFILRFLTFSLCANFDLLCMATVCLHLILNVVHDRALCGLGIFLINQKRLTTKLRKTHLVKMDITVKDD